MGLTNHLLTGMILQVPTGSLDASENSPWNSDLTSPKVSQAHRDLKPENILLFGPELLAKLGEPWASEGWKMEFFHERKTASLHLKMENFRYLKWSKKEGFLYLIRLCFFGGWGNFPYISRIHTAFFGWGFRTILGTKCLVIFRI